ncbi:hypothetical protein [Campylobacter phage CJLB-12]|nr:hypothetical protein [Campylobacter phage CJLB-12]
MLGFLVVYTIVLYPSICLKLKAKLKLILKSIKNAWLFSSIYYLVSICLKLKAILKSIKNAWLFSSI